ncbi:MAG TPA: ribonuclease J [Blastocatellia bacterium]|jgi:ribonuclease J|nr:ribonuclease J [Blastocatellia bacterium]
MTDRQLEIIPLGGVGHFGMNMMAMRAGGEAIIIDAGMGFPEEDLPGVDIVIPDFSFIDEYRDEITAIVLTHGHEDHIGAVPFLLKEINVPVYGTHLTLALLGNKLEEHGLSETVQLHSVESRDRVKLGAFEVEWIHVSHSLTSCTAVAITTPVGVVIHSGDFKIDDTPVVGPSIDLERLTEYGDQGVLALLADSTNAERPGRTQSERAVIPAFEKIFEEATGRIVVSCFTSSVHRVQIVLDMARDFGRNVALLGRSMLRNVETADSLRQLDAPDGMFVTPAQARQMDDDRLVLLAAGCQGDPMSAMTKLATDQHKNLSVGEGDLVVLSARNIPGNERAISRLISHCYKRGAQVIDSSIARIHVSGHGSQDDLKILIEATRPKFLVPIHGEYRQLYRHKEWASTLGIVEPGNIVIIENGDVLELDESSAKITAKEFVGRTFIDGTYGEVQDIVVRDRKHLAYDGIVVPIVAINPTSGEVEAEPEIVTRGFVHEEDPDGIVVELKQLVEDTINSASHEERIDCAVIKEKIRLELKRFIQKGTGRRPMIIPVVIEV